MSKNKPLIFIFIFIFNSSLFAQTNTDLFLFTISNSDGKIKLTNPENITNRTGYDNQPFFHPKKSLLFYTAMENQQTDIWGYDLKTKSKKQITATEDSEYSPTLIPGGNAISCIVQRKANGDQDLVKIDLNDPSKTEILLESQKTGKVGYQAWLNESNLITYILGTPQTLHLHKLDAQTDKTIVANISRSLHLIPQTNEFSFVQEMNNKWMIRTYNPKSNLITDLTESDANSEHYNAWKDRNTLIESRNTELFSFDLKSKKWSKVEFPEGFIPKKISRLAIKGDLMVVVMEE